MEDTRNQNDTFDEQNSPEQHQLVVTENMRSYFYDMANWAKFLGIVGFIFSGLMLIAALLFGAVSTTLGSKIPGMDMYGALGGGVMSFVLILYSLMFLYPSYLLFSHSVKTKQGVLYADQQSLEEGVQKIKSLFKFYGILTIVIIGFYAFVFILALLGGMAAAA